MADKTKIAIIGGGLSGLVAAYEITKQIHDADISLYEASDRLGGRVETDTVHKIPLELGGFMIFPWYKEYRSLLRDLNLEKNLIRPCVATEYYEIDDTLISEKEVRFFELVPIKLIISLLVRRFTFRLRIHTPTKSSYGSQSIQDVYKKLGVPERTQKIHQAIFHAYTYPPANKLSASVYFPLIYKLFLGGMFKRFEVLPQGNQTVIDELVSRLKSHGVSINTEARVKSIKKRKLNFSTGQSEKYDVIINAGGLDLHDINPYIFSKKLEYTHFNAVYLRMKSEPSFMGTKDWSGVYRHAKPETDSSLYLSCIANCEPVMGPGYDKVLLTYIGSHEDHNLTQEQALDIVKSELPKQLGDVQPTEVIDIHKWGKTMPITSISYIEKIRSAQSLDGIFYAGDYLAGPSMETATWSGKNAAKLVTKHIMQLRRKG